jgi:uncharacterized protein (DUF58 family)
LVDLSASQNLGTTTQNKRELITELGAMLAMSAVKNNDKVGLTLFTDGVEKSFRPQKGSRHVLRLIRELLYCQPIGTGTCVRRALEHLNKTAKRRAVVFLISDFQDGDYEATLRVARRKHDIIPVVITDPREADMPNVGLVRLRDEETGECITLDTASRKNRDLYAKLFRQQSDARDQLFGRLRLTPIHLETGADITQPLIKYFHQREGQS